MGTTTNREKSAQAGRKDSNRLGTLATDEKDSMQLTQGKVKVDRHSAQVRSDIDKVRAEIDFASYWGENFGEKPTSDTHCLDERASSVAFLHSHGIRVAPEALDPLVKEAIARLQRTLYREDPREDLTAVEAEILQRGGFSLEPEEVDGEDPLLQTMADYAALLKRSLSTVEAAQKLGVDPSRIRQRLTAMPPTLYGIRIGTSWYLPEFQFDGGGLVRGLGEVVSRLDQELHPVAVLRWFITPNPDLSAEGLGDRTLSPRDWLRMGLPVEPVAEMASNL